MANALHLGRYSRSSSIVIAENGFVTAVAAVGVVLALTAGFRPLNLSMSEEEDVELVNEGTELISESSVSRLVRL